MRMMYLIPWVDIFLGLLFLGLVAIGFWQGLLKEFWLLLSLYLAAVLALLTGDRVGALMQQGLGVSAPEIASTWGFLFVVALGTALIYSILYALVGHLRLPSTLLSLDKIGGVALGLITAFLITSFIAYTINVLIPFGPEEWAFTDALKVQRETAAPVLKLFLRARPVVLTTVQVWLPATMELPYFMEPFY